MEPEKRLKLIKIIVTVVICVIAFLIILGSALLTRSARAKKENKQKVVIGAQTVDDEEIKTENNLQDNEVVENEHNFEEVLNQIQESLNQTENKPIPEVTTDIRRLPVSNPNSIELCKAAQSSDAKDIYLTFDDGPSPNITPQILDVLERYNVPATFFVLGSRVELYPELVKKEYEAGHYIANHGYSHSYSSIYSSEQAVLDEYNRTEKAVQDALGIPEYHTLLFRFPGGSSGGPYNDLKQSAKRTLENMGIASTNWNCLTGDAEAVGRTKEQLLQRLYETASGWNSLVVLMHDANDKQATVDALPEIIEHYQNQGYTFKNYYEIFK